MSELEKAHRLMAQLARGLNQANKRLMAENAKLRAALEQISIHYPDPSPAGMIARAALEEIK